jgi:ABC-type transport system substrate-binding protein
MAMPRSIRSAVDRSFLTDSIPAFPYTSEKNASYYRAGEPHADGAFLHIIPDVATQLAGLRAGELDYVPVDQQNVASIRATNPAIQLVDWEYLLWPFSAQPGNSWRRPAIRTASKSNWSAPRATARCS